jgi:hypothetical protein
MNGRMCLWDLSAELNQKNVAWRVICIPGRLIERALHADFRAPDPHGEAKETAESVLKMLQKVISQSAATR